MAQPVAQGRPPIELAAGQRRQGQVRGAGGAGVGGEQAWQQLTPDRGERQPRLIGAPFGPEGVAPGGGMGIAGGGGRQQRQAFGQQPAQQPLQPGGAGGVGHARGVRWRLRRQQLAQQHHKALGIREHGLLQARAELGRLAIAQKRLPLAQGDGQGGRGFSRAQRGRGGGLRCGSGRRRASGRGWSGRLERPEWRR